MTPVNLQRAPFPPRMMLVEMERQHHDLRQALRDRDPRLIVLRLEDGLGGIWTDYTPDGEVVRFGFPAQSEHAYFQIMTPRAFRSTAFDITLERMVYARRVTDVVCAEPAVVFPVAHALTIADAVLWCEDAACNPGDLARHRDLVPRFRETPEARAAMLEALAQRMAIGGAA